MTEASTGTGSEARAALPAGPDDLVRAGLLGGLDPDAVELLRAAFASPRPWTAEFY